MTTNDSFRFGYSQINDYNAIFVDIPSNDLASYDAHNTSLLEEMYAYAWSSNGTPLRRGLERVGRYYDDYYAGYVDPITSACQQNYAVLFTDGY